MQLKREIKSFEKTLKGFDALAKKTRLSPIKSKSGRRIRKISVLLLAAITVLMVVVPPFKFPVEGAVSSSFFLRQRPESVFIFDIETHRGIDLAAPMSTPIFASAPGVVREVGFSESYGNYIRIRHALGFETFYAHLSETHVKEGSLVVLRTVRKIGEVGSTGRSTGPHLHFETRLANRSLPPRFFLVFHGIRRQIFGF